MVNNGLYKPSKPTTESRDGNKPAVNSNVRVYFEKYPNVVDLNNNRNMNFAIPWTPIYVPDIIKYCFGCKNIFGFKMRNDNLK